MRVQSFLSVCVTISLHFKRLHSLNHTGQSNHLQSHISEVFLLTLLFGGLRRLLLELQVCPLAFAFEDGVRHHELVQVHKVVFALGLDPDEFILAH